MSNKNEERLYAAAAPSDEPLRAGMGFVAEDYFRTMGIPILKGRDFATVDSHIAPPVVIINKVMARKYWPDEDPLGKRLIIADGPSREIVGVVGDVRHFGLDKEPRAEMYVPYQQAPFLFLGLIARTTVDPMSLMSNVKAQVQAVDKDQPVSNFKTMDQYLSDSIAHPRFQSYLLSIFAALAVLLATIGLYGVMSYSVAQQTREIGVRMALGAQQSDVLMSVIKQGMVLTLSGITVGVAIALALTRLLKTLLFGVNTTDPVTFAVITLLLTAVALLACYMPARRAAKVDPLVALRYE